MSEHKYEVYIARFEGHVLYVGQDKAGRHTHCNSGRSSVVNLNKVLFNFGEMCVEVQPCESEIESIRKEKVLIRKLKPIFNKKWATYNHKGRVSTYKIFLKRLRADDFYFVPLEMGELLDEIETLETLLHVTTKIMVEKHCEVMEKRKQLDFLTVTVNTLKESHQKFSDLTNMPAYTKADEKAIFKKLRSEGYTQKECADFLGKHERTIMRWEKLHKEGGL